MAIPVFKMQPSTVNPVQIPEQWPSVRSGFINKCNRLIDYYRTAMKPVNNQHKLVTLIQNAVMSPMLPVETYYKYADQEAVANAAKSGIGSYSMECKPNNGFFYSDDNSEIIYIYRNSEYPADVDYEWRKYTSVKALMIPQSDASIALPGGIKYSAEKGITVIGVNVAALMTQYRAFTKAQANKPVQQSVHTFIAQNVLPSMMATEMDLIWMNRIVNRWYGKKCGDVGLLYKHPCSTVDFQDQLDVVADKVIDNLRKIGNPTFPALLQNIPAFSTSNMAEALVLPDCMSLSQSDWMYVAARLKYYNFLFDVAGKKVRNSNPVEITTFVRQMSLYDTVNKLKANLSPAQWKEAQSYITNIQIYSGSF